MFYFIDKPIGISSFDVIRKLRKLLGIKKMGHTGTLDPLASGCILIATDHSTKLLPLLEGSDKTYIFTIDISGTTPSLDLGTDITIFGTSEYRERTHEELRAFLLSQTEQIPPRYSAIHIDGRRAYELAREEVDFEIQSRPIQVKEVEIIRFSPPIFTLSLRISSGGYIRSFAPIIGNFFGSDGGYITELRRTDIHTHQVSLSVSQAQSLDTITQDSYIPRITLFPEFESIEIDRNIQLCLQQGRLINSIPGIQGTIGRKYFLDYEGSWSSLVEYKEDGFHIIRNDI